MQSLLNSSDSTCARTFQAKYTRVDDVELPPSRRRPNLQFSTLKRRSSDQKKPQSLDYSVCYNTPYREFIQKNATKRFIGNLSVNKVTPFTTTKSVCKWQVVTQYCITYLLNLCRRVTEDLGKRGQLDYGRYNRDSHWSCCILDQLYNKVS